jgi:energy-coupling factor transport system ATP-binding protein
VDTIIRVEGLHHIYPGSTHALRGIDLEVAKGEILAVIGQNGSGKTTLVKHFNGLLKPTQGIVWIGENGDRKDTRQYTTAALSRIVGYVFQNPNHQICCQTVGQEVAFGPKNLDLEPDEVASRVKEALSLFKLEDFKEYHPFDLALAQKKMLGIASIYAMGPQVIVLDEPTTGQDPAGVRLIEGITRELNRLGHTVIVISHDMRFVARTADRIVVMWNGKILLEGEAREVFRQRETLGKTNLHPPQITELAQDLSDFSFPDDIMSLDEMVEAVVKKIGRR